MQRPILLNRVALKRRGITISNSTLLRLEASGGFPQRVRLAKNSVAWIAAEIDAYLDELASAREVA